MDHAIQGIIHEKRFKRPTDNNKQGGIMGDKDKALELALTQIEKQFGKGSIMKLGQAGSQKGVDVISTGSISLDS